MKTRIGKLLENTINEEKFKQFGQWAYYYDGSGGAFFAKTSVAKLKKVMDDEDYDQGSPLPFETAIPDGDKDIMFYRANSDYPYLTINIDDYNSEYETDYEDIYSFMADDQL